MGALLLGLLAIADPVRPDQHRHQKGPIVQPGHAKTQGQTSRCIHLDLADPGPRHSFVPRGPHRRHFTRIRTPYVEHRTRRIKLHAPAPAHFRVALQVLPGPTAIKRFVQQGILRRIECPVGCPFQTQALRMPLWIAGQPNFLHLHLLQLAVPRMQDVVPGMHRLQVLCPDFDPAHIMGCQHIIVPPFKVGHARAPAGGAGKRSPLS